MAAANATPDAFGGPEKGALVAGNNSLLISQNRAGPSWQKTPDRIVQLIEQKGRDAEFTFELTGVDGFALKIDSLRLRRPDVRRGCASP